MVLEGSIHSGAMRTSSDIVLGVMMLLLALSYLEVTLTLRPVDALHFGIVPSYEAWPTPSRLGRGERSPRLTLVLLFGSKNLQVFWGCYIVYYVKCMLTAITLQNLDLPRKSLDKLSTRHLLLIRTL